MARSFKRKEGIIPFSASNTSRLQLSRNFHVQNYLLKIKITHTNTSAVFTAKTLFELINNLQVVANGSQTLKSIPGIKLWIDTVLSTEKEAKKSVNSANGDQVSYAYALLNFSSTNTIRPHDTILNTSIFTTLDLIVDWGSAANLGTGIVITDAELQVVSNQLTNYSRNPGERITYYKENSLVEELNSTSNEFMIQLPTELVYNRFAVCASVDGVYSDDVIKNIKIKSGTTVFMDWSYDDFKAFNDLQYAIQGADFKGITILDFIERSFMTDGLDTRKIQGRPSFSTLELILDVVKQSGTNKIHVFSDYLEQTGIVEVALPKA
jgi:hypothetical protein